jgi:hypothetical protein
MATLFDQRPSFPVILGAAPMAVFRAIAIVLISLALHRARMIGGADCLEPLSALRS